MAKIFRFNAEGRAFVQQPVPEKFTLKSIPESSTTVSIFASGALGADSVLDREQSNPKQDLPWYERPNGTCNFLQPTLINMGDDKPLHLMFPVHWSESLAVLPQARNLARELNALLVVMLYGEASDNDIESLSLEFAKARVLPLWIGEKNRRKFDRIIAMLLNKTYH